MAPRGFQEETLGERAVNLKSIGQVFLFLNSIAKSIVSQKSIVSVDNLLSFSLKWSYAFFGSLSDSSYFHSIPQSDAE
jgi:hypothetical protein